MTRSEIDRILLDLATKAKRSSDKERAAQIIENRRKLAILEDMERRGVKISWNVFYKTGRIEPIEVQ